jgi:predicted regulator of Ras-like GTPase activity (Roadblock/LC7/MglB family)
LPLYETEYENLLRILQEFQATSADVESAMLLTADGIPLAWSLPKTYDNAQVAYIATLVAAAAALGTALTEVVWQSQPKMLSFAYENAYLIVVPLYPDIVLAVLARNGAKLALIFLDIGHYFGPRALAGIILPGPPSSLNARARPEDDGS